MNEGDEMDPYRQAQQMKEREERSLMQLFAVMAPHRHDPVMAELQRRADLFAKTWQETDRGGWFSTPRGAAAESLYHDVARGWL